MHQIMSTKILENDLHVFVVSWRTQEIMAYRDILTGEITHGSEDKIESCGYVAVMTRIEDELEDTTTGGWKIIDVSLLVLSHCFGMVLTKTSHADGKKSSIELSRTSLNISVVAIHPPLFASSH